MTSKQDNRRPTMTSPALTLQWVLIPAFSIMTGYTEKAVRRKLEDGVWVIGKHYKKAPDGRVTMNLQEYYKWVEQN